MRTLGFDAANDIFAENAWYFRNSLVRANYNDLKNGIHETTEFLELFLRNFLLNEAHPLHNRTLHTSGIFREIEKPDIESEKHDIEEQKVDIEEQKADIEELKAGIEELKTDIEELKTDIEKKFQPKTASHILKIRQAFPGQTIFGRSDVMEILDIKPSRASELLKEMAEYGVIESVSGHGKGKYRFRKQVG